MLDLLWILVLSGLVLFIALRVLPIRRVTVYEYQKGLKYTKGRYVETLNSGQYWIFSPISSIALVDVRPEFVSVQGQDILSADGVSLKVSLAAEFQITDPNTAINKQANFRNSLYLTLQMAAREIVGKEEIDALIANRSKFSGNLVELVSPKADQYGLKLISADVKDIMFPGEMKKVFSQVVKARKEGQAALEKARGETAALRNLANAAKMIEDNPNLLQIRALQAVAESTGNTLVLGVPNGTIPILKKEKERPASTAKESEET